MDFTKNVKNSREIMTMLNAKCNALFHRIITKMTNKTGLICKKILNSNTKIVIQQSEQNM